MPPLVSVVIPTFNRAKLLPRAIESVLGQDYPSIELIVVDDGSTDGTPSVLAGYAERIRVLQQENLERGAARNAGAAQSLGEYLAFLDSDDEWRPDHVAGLVAGLKRAPDAGLAYRQARLVDENGRAFYVAPESPITGDVFSVLSLENIFVLPAVMVTRPLFERVGGFDEDRSLIGAEDWELWVRCTALAPVVFVPGITVTVNHHRGNTMGDASRVELGLREVEGRILSGPLTRDRVNPKRLHAHVVTMIARYYRLAGDPAAARRVVARELGHHPTLVMERRMIKTVGMVLRP